MSERNVDDFRRDLRRMLAVMMAGFFVLVENCDNADELVYALGDELQLSAAIYRNKKPTDV